ncbi:HAD family hydrolase [Cyclobacterium plantarum]|uniref:Uncharacterized protein n=1 Tax=Cyclobacterium plantarum TaxID=2716263 RepID=A0ABX0H7X1_9BACT|nr:HAD family hydrolase [Cyclobacterium plantarum]NHE57951.1 hypothetical protein [Cyclobacterium plantarum]
MAYNNKFKIEYSDINNRKTVIYIKEDNYNGELITLESFGSEPLTIKWYGEGEKKFNPIMQSECRINLLSTKNFEFIEFSDFPEKKYRIEVLKENEAYWDGFLVPDNYNEDFVTPPYEVSIKAIDYLTTLKDIPFKDSNDEFIYEDSISIISVLKVIFDKIGLQLDIYDGLDISYQANQFSTGILFNTHINTRAFINNLYQDNQEAWNCEDVVLELMKVFAATLKQNKGRWEITNFNLETFNFYKYSGITGNFLGIDSISQTKYLDDHNLKIVEGSSNIEIEGGKKSLTIIQDKEAKEPIIKGGNLFDDAWINSSNHKYFSNNGFISRENNGFIFTLEYSNNTYATIGEAQTASKSDYIGITVNYNRLPLQTSRIDKFIDFVFESQLMVDYDHPPERITDPTFDEDIYQNWAEKQLQDFFENLTFGHYVRIESNNTTKNQTARLSYTADYPTEQLYLWSTNTPDWTPFITDTQDFDYIEARRYIRRYTLNQESKEPMNFKNPDYNYTKRFNMYRVLFLVGQYDEYSEYISLGDEGTIKFDISAPHFWNVQNYHTDVPTKYQININRVNNTIKRIEIDHPNISLEIEKEYQSIIKDDNVKVLETIETVLGDGNLRDLGALQKSDGSLTDVWFRNNEELPILQHTANRIIEQYSKPSFTFRSEIFGDDLIDLNDIIFNPSIDRTFKIQGLEISDKEQMHNIELVELSKPFDLSVYEAIESNKSNGIPLSFLTGDQSNIYDLSFAIIGLLGNKEYEFIADTIVDELFALQNVDGSFNEYIENGILQGDVTFKSNAILFYSLNFYIKYKMHNQSKVNKAKSIVDGVFTFIDGNYFNNPIKLGFDSTISTIDNIVYYFGLKLFDLNVAKKLRKSIENNLVKNGSLIYGLQSDSNNFDIINDTSLLLKVYAYLFTKNSSYINEFSVFESNGIYKNKSTDSNESIHISGLAALCLFKSRNYSEFNSIKELIRNQLLESNGNSLLPKSIFLIIDSKLKNNFFK